MIIKIENGVAVGNPILEENFRYLYPSISFPLVFTNEIVEPYGYAMYDFSQVPVSGVYQKVIEVAPAMNEFGIWRQQWSVVDLIGDELTAKQAQVEMQFKKAMVAATQRRLDDFARTRNFDGILSACSYAASSVPTFAAEGQYCLQARDETWAALIQYYTDVQNAVHPVPTGFADIEPFLPALVWPN